jgi:hypothetical protein
LVSKTAMDAVVNKEKSLAGARFCHFAMGL